MHGNSRWVLAAQVYIWAPPFNHRARRTIEASLEWSRAVQWINIERIVKEYFTLMKKNLLHVDSKWEQLERNDTFIRAVASAAVASVVSDSEWPHRWQPTRLCHPWGSPYRKTGVGGLTFPSPVHESEKWKWSRSVVSDSSRPHGLQPTRLLCSWDFPGKSTGVGCHYLLHLF